MKITIKEKEALENWVNLRKEQFGKDTTEQEKIDYLKMLKKLDKFNKMFGRY